MIVSGRISIKMMPVLSKIWEQMPEPKWCISMGACASCGGIFDTYALIQGVDNFIPVDVYVPGCPPRPESLIDAVMKIQEIVEQGSDWGSARCRSAPDHQRTAARGVDDPEGRRPPSPPWICRQSHGPGEVHLPDEVVGEGSYARRQQWIEVRRERMLDVLTRAQGRARVRDVDGPHRGGLARSGPARAVLRRVPAVFADPQPVLPGQGLGPRGRPRRGLREPPCGKSRTGPSARSTICSGSRFRGHPDLKRILLPEY
jgi:hypothetical protein